MSTAQRAWEGEREGEREGEGKGKGRGRERGWEGRSHVAFPPDHTLSLPQPRPLTVNLVGHQYAGYLWPVLPELLVPDGEVLVGHLPSDVKDEHTRMCLVVVGWVHSVEALLASSVPEVYTGMWQERGGDGERMGGRGGEGRGGEGRGGEGRGGL